MSAATASQFVRTIEVSLAASSFVKRPPLPKPALLTSTSTVSPRDSTSPVIFLRPRSLDTSPVTTSASTP